MNSPIKLIAGCLMAALACGCALTPQPSKSKPESYEGTKDKDDAREQKVRAAVDEADRQLGKQPPDVPKAQSELGVAKTGLRETTPQLTKEAQARAERADAAEYETAKGELFRTRQELETAKAKLLTLTTENDRLRIEGENERQAGQQKLFGFCGVVLIVLGALSLALRKNAWEAGSLAAGGVLTAGVPMLLDEVIGSAALAVGIWAAVVLTIAGVAWIVIRAIRHRKALEYSVGFVESLKKELPTEKVDKFHDEAGRKMDRAEKAVVSSVKKAIGLST